MIRLVLGSAAILGLAGFLATAPLVAQDAAGVTAAAEAVFPEGASFSGVALQGLTLGAGIFIATDESAAGQFQAVLEGTSVLGAAQEILVEGEVRTGTVDSDGSATFSGTARVDLGDGGVPVTGVPFQVSASAGSLTLTLNGTELPTAAVSAGSITVR